MEIKMKYTDISGAKFFHLINKIAEHPTTNKNASHIHQIVKRINVVRDTMIAEYDKMLTQVFATKDKDGKIIRPVFENGIVDQHGFTPIAGREEEFMKAQEAFGQREFIIDYKPLTPSVIGDLKLSANEIGLLGPLLAEQDGPGVPDMPEIKGMPGMNREVRRAESRA